MCGIVGYSPHTVEFTHADRFKRLFEESTVRGRHAYGIVDTRMQPVKSFFAEDIPAAFVPGCPTIAHARYCQSGDWRVMANNQPLIVGNAAIAMNGVIHMGTKEEFEADWGVTCIADNDSEIFLQWLRTIGTAASFFQRLTGSFAAVWLEEGMLYAARNPRRPLYYTDCDGARWYASTQDIFRRAGFLTLIHDVRPLEVHA